MDVVTRRIFHTESLLSGGTIALHLDSEIESIISDGYASVPWKSRLGGARLATLLSWLSDLPPGGGGRTVFPLLGLTVPPKQGDVLTFFLVISTFSEIGMLEI